MTAMMRVLIFLAVFLVSPATAHNKSLSFSQWMWNGRTIDVSFTLPARNITILPNAIRAPTLAQALGPHLDTHIGAKQVTSPCRQKAPFRELPAQKGYIKMATTFACPSNADNLTITINTLFDLAGSHVHFARVIRTANDVGGTELLFTANQREFTLSTDRGGALIARSGFLQTLSNYFRHGVTHILSGIDHLAFLMCLILLAPTYRRLIVLVLSSRSAR